MEKRTRLTEYLNLMNRVVDKGVLILVADISCINENETEGCDVIMRTGSTVPVQESYGQILGMMEIS